MSIPNPFAPIAAGVRSDWGSIYLVNDAGPMLIPGSVQSVNGCDRAEKWLVQQGIGQTLGVSVWRGTMLIESIKIETILYDAASFDAYLKLEAAFPVLKASGQTAATYSVVHPAFQFAKILRVGRKMFSSPTVPPGLKCAATIELIEYKKPKIAPIGPPDPAKPETENQRKARILAEKIEVAKRL